MRARRGLVVAGVAASVMALLSGCVNAAADPGPTGSTDAELAGELTVFAAASLQGAFDELAEAFEDAHRHVDVRPIVYDGSSTLVAQLVEGATADVFASADESTMRKAVDEGLAADPDVFATNTLVVAVPAGNPGGVEELADLADDSVTVVLCAVEVPCGAASQRLLENTGVPVAPASFEQNVTSVLTKVAAGEADAGLVYATDVEREPDVESFVPEGAADVVNRYPIAALDGAANPSAAAAFVAFVRGPEGQAVLAEHGFGAP